MRSKKEVRDFLQNEFEKVYKVVEEYHGKPIDKNFYIKLGVVEGDVVENDVTKKDTSSEEEDLNVHSPEFLRQT